MVENAQLLTKNSIMFWGTPKLPLREGEQLWIESSFRWLLAEFGESALLDHTTVLPESAFFPDKYNRTDEAALAVVLRVCGYMKVDPRTIEVEFFSDREEIASRHQLGGETDHRGAAGYYLAANYQQQSQTIAINFDCLPDPMKLVATAAHELGHVILLGGGRVSREEKDHEFLTDLITVFLGLGIFTANSAFQFSQWQSHSHQGWSASRLGYMSEEMFAYSLAVYAWLRGEETPKWSRYLAMNVGHHFKQSLRYLQKGGQTSMTKLGPRKS